MTSLPEQPLCLYCLERDSRCVAMTRDSALSYETKVSPATALDEHVRIWPQLMVLLHIDMYKQYTYFYILKSVYFWEIYWIQIIDKMITSVYFFIIFTFTAAYFPYANKVNKLSQWQLNGNFHCPSSSWQEWCLIHWLADSF